MREVGRNDFQEQDYAIERGVGIISKDRTDVQKRSKWK